jgi:transcription initiation factor TFIIIB Brf1 subunit/transcription initiation factor TFIIB
MTTSTTYNDIWDDLFNSKSIKEVITQKTKYSCLCTIVSPYITDTGLVCDTCGTELERIYISDSKENRNFSNEDGTGNGTSMERCGGIYDDLLPSSSMSTIIQGDSKLSKLNLWISIPYSEKVIIDLKKKLNELVIIYNLPNSIISSTLYFFQGMLKNKEIHRGKIRNGLIAASIYYSAKNLNVNLLASVLLEMFDIDKKVFSRCCKMYCENNDVSNDLKTEITVVDILSRLCNQLDIPFKFQRLCKKLILASDKLQMINNFAPQSIASSIIYFVCQELNHIVDLDTISELSDTSVSTIKKVYKVFFANKVELYNYTKYNLV